MTPSTCGQCCFRVAAASMKLFRPNAGRSRGGTSTSTVLVIAGTRPESIKLAPVVWALDADRALGAVVVNSGQHPTAVRTAFDEFGVRHDVELDVLPALPNLLASFEHLRTELRAVIARFQPRCVLVQGDTLTSYAAAVAGATVAARSRTSKRDCARSPRRSRFPRNGFGAASRGSPMFISRR